MNGNTFFLKRPGGHRALGCCLEVEKKMEIALFHYHCVLLEPAAAIGNDL